MEDLIKTKRKTYRLDGADALNENISAKKEYLYSEEAVDQHGNILYKLAYNKNGEPESRTEAIYEGENILQEKVINLYDDIEEIIEYEYNKNKELIAEYVLYSDEKIIHQSYEYGPGGNLITTIYYDDGEEDSRDCFEYDDQGNKIKRERVDNEDELAESETFEYNSNGKLAKAIFEYAVYDAQNQDYQYITKITLYEYDSNDALIVEFNPEENTRLNFTRDENGKITEYCRYTNDEIVDKNVITYDQNGRTLTENVLTGIDCNSHRSAGSCNPNDSFSLRYEYDNV